MSPTTVLPQPPAVPMAPGLLALDPARDAHFAGNDGVLELDVPAGAVTPSDIAAAGGAVNLLVRQVLPAGGGNAGGSGHFTFGTFLVQAVDAHGQLLARGLRKPAAVHLHYDRRGSALDLSHTVVTFNPTLPSWIDLSPSSVKVGQAQVGATGSAASPARTQTPRPSTSTSQAAGLGATSRTAAAVDAANQSLSVAAPLSPNTVFSFDTDSPVATFGRPDPFTADLNGGALVSEYPIDLPAGPGGLTPPLGLRYSSAAINEQHNALGAAPWVGEGWSLSLGSVSWSEHDFNSVCYSGCGQLWQDSWQLDDPYGSGTELIPPNTSVATYNEDSPNPISASPITWHSVPESHARIISFTGPNTIPGVAAIPPCFRVFLPSGLMEEFGCTPDSTQ